MGRSRERSGRHARWPGRALAVALLLAPAGALAELAAGEDALRLDVSGTFLRPNLRRADGSAAYLHVTPDDMPWRIAVGLPAVPPRYGSREDARRGAIESMQMWESAIRPVVPWFRLVFVEDDPDAPVQVRWKRRITGPFGGFGRQEPRSVGGQLRVGGEMQISTTPDPYTTLTLDEVRLLVAHEFGHVLGLGHCLDCDSAMNYAWHTRGRVFVTDVDVRTFQALLAQPNPPTP